jgi:maltose-binding protein MalE
MTKKKLIGAILGSLTLATPALAEETTQASSQEEAKTDTKKDKGAEQACRTVTVTVDKGSEQACKTITVEMAKGTEQACRTVTVELDKGSEQACKATEVQVDMDKGTEASCKGSHQVNGNSRHGGPLQDR